MPPTSPADEPTRYFFVHLQKTAGTAFFRRLRHQFAPAAIYPDPSDGDLVHDAPQLSVPRLLERWAARGHEVRIVTGHFPLCTTELLGVPFTTITVLREPVERTLSYLRHHRVLTPEDRDRPLEEIYDDPFRFQGMIHNHMVKMLSLTPAEMTAGMLTPVDFTEDHLTRAVANLATVDEVGLQEDFDAFAAGLEQRLGWDLGPAQFANRTAAVEVDDALRERIEADNALDVALYREACELVARRAAARAAAGAAGDQTSSGTWSSG